MKKKFLALFTAFVTVLFLFSFTGKVVQAQEKECILQLNSKIAVINGETYELDTLPKVVNGNTMLPFRFIAENILDAHVSWEQSTKTVSFKKEDRLVILTIGSHEALVDGEKKTLPLAPFIENGRTLVPLRFLGENFDLNVDYLAEEKKIILSPKSPQLEEPEEPEKPEIPINLPIAQFKFKDPEIVAGQNVEVIDESYDIDGYKILERKWEIEKDGEIVTTNDINSTFKTPTAGTYKVRLQVRNELWLWSETFEEELIVHPNKKPEIKSFSPKRKTVDQGERVDFSYKVDNEEWEKIVEERWSYRFLTDPNKKELSDIGKPKAFFYPGEYEVSLQVRDEYGNWSEPSTTTIKVTTKELISEFGFKFRDPTPGEVILNPHNINFNQYEIYENVKARRTGPTMLFSNSPEAVTRTGILYQDTVSGPIRVMFHHKNNISDTSKKYRLVVIVENTSTTPAVFTLTKSASGGPSGDVMHLGQVVAKRYYESQMRKSQTILPGKKILLYDSLPSNWRNGQTITGMFDFETNVPLKITIAAVEADFNLDNYGNLPILPRDERHFRGTFPKSDILIDVELKGKDITKIVLGKDKEGFEEWLEGYDNLTGDKVINKGNYGMVYKFTFTANSKVGILINPRGLTFKGAFQGFDEKIYGAPGIGAFYGLNKAAVVGVLENGETRSLIYTPPNGSDAPVLLIIMPENTGKKFKERKCN